MKPVCDKNVNTAKVKYSMVFIFTISIIIILAAGKKASSQDAVFSQFYANPLYLNPAFAGAGQCTRLIMNYRNQPFPLFGTFSTYSLSGDMHVKWLSGGVGFNIIHDNQASLISHTQASAFYAWQTRLSENWNISIGLQGGYVNSRVNTYDFIFADQYSGGGTTGSTGELLMPEQNIHTVDFSTGVLFYTDKFYGGASLHHLNTPVVGPFDDYRLEPKFSLMAGYTIDLLQSNTFSSDNISLSPNVIFQSQSDYYRINYGLYANIEALTAGLWLRQNFNRANSLIFTVGIKRVNYAVGYSYDYSLSGFSTTSGGAHELGVLLNFNCPDPKSRYRILNCPTF